MNTILQVIYSLFSGIILSFAIPNEIYLFGFPFLSFISLIPYYLAFYKVKNFKSAFLIGFIQASTTHICSSYWLAYFKDFAAITLGASTFGTGLIGGIFGFFLYFPFSTKNSKNELNKFSLSNKTTNSLFLKMIYFPFVYVLYEWIKSTGFLGYPWGTVSMAVYKCKYLVQISDISGTYGITFIILLFNCIFAEFIRFYTNNIFYKQQKNSVYEISFFTKKSLFSSFINDLFSKKRSAFLGKVNSSLIFDFLTVFIFTLVLFISTEFYGFIQYNKVRKPIKTVSTILVQQNSDPWKESSDEDSILLSQKLTKNEIENLEQKEQKAELVVWSEGVLQTAFPYGEFYYQNNPFSSPLSEFIKKSKVPFLIGGSYVKNREEGKYFNAALIFDSNGNWRGAYGKNHLVPFAEAIPFMEFPIVKSFMSKIIGISAGWTPGDQYVFFEVPCSPTKEYRTSAIKNIDITKSKSQQKKEEYENELVKVKFSTPICFDDAFPDVIRPMFLGGAELFVNITDDSWSLKKSSEIQHFVVSSFRAIEYRTTLVRSSNAGYSVIVSPNGKILCDQPLFEQNAISYNVPIFMRKMTTYAKFGNWFPILISIFCVIYLSILVLESQKPDIIHSERKIKKSKKKKKKH